METERAFSKCNLIITFLGLWPFINFDPDHRKEIVSLYPRRRLWESVTFPPI